MPTDWQADIDRTPPPVVAVSMSEQDINWKDYILVKQNAEPATRLVGYVRQRGHFPNKTHMSSVLRWKSKHGSKRRSFDVKSGFAHMRMVCHRFKEKQRTNETCDADDPESLWSRHCADSDFSGEFPKCRFEVLILKSDAIAAGLSEDLWNSEVEMTDPVTKQKYKCRHHFKHAISSRETLDICPKWMRACDGHDVNLPLRIMSKVKVPADAELGVVWHKTNLTKGGYRNAIKHGLKKTHGGRHRIFGDAFWKTRTTRRGV
jgi:hypothetical protein